MLFRSLLRGSSLRRLLLMLRRAKGGVRVKGGRRLRTGSDVMRCLRLSCFRDEWRFAFAGGCPAASYFLCAAKESNQRKAAPLPPPLRGALRYSMRRAAAELGPTKDVGPQTVLADFPRRLCVARRLLRGRPKHCCGQVLVSLVQAALPNKRTSCGSLIVA